MKSWILIHFSSMETDIDTRLAKAWTAMNCLSVIWTSDLTDKIKRSFFFQAAVVSILLYGCTTWTITKRMEKKFDGNYTRTQQVILNKSWRQHPKKLLPLRHQPPITKTIKIRRARHVEHCWRSWGELVSDVSLWTPSHERTKAGRPTRTYIQQLCVGIGFSLEDRLGAMDDRDAWQEKVREIRAIGVKWW